VDGEDIVVGSDVGIDVDDTSDVDRESMLCGLQAATIDNKTMAVASIIRCRGGEGRRVIGATHLDPVPSSSANVDQILGSRRNPIPRHRSAPGRVSPSGGP